MENNADFIGSWDRIMSFGAYACGAVAILILLYHEFRILMIKDYKEKYDYVNLHEVRYFWYAVIAIITGVALYANSIATGSVFGNNTHIWFYVRIFMTASFAVIAYIVFFSLVRIYYPRFVEKRLNKLRNKPRVSPQGNLMRKLAHAEEEAHLEESQFNEQHEIHSVDYDVWLDEKTGFKKIEKYNAYQHAIECPECGYVTFRVVREEIAETPSIDKTGVLIKHFKCSYCSHRAATENVIAKLSENVPA